MTGALRESRFMTTLALALIAGAGLALAFTVLGNVGAWLAILAVVTALGVSPVIAGWMSPKLSHVFFFPVIMLGCLSVASAIHGPLSLDSDPVAFVILLTAIYGGMASLAFVAGWMTRQFLHRLRGRPMPVSRLALASLVAACLSLALGILFVTTPLASLAPLRSAYWSAVLGPMGLLGVAAASAIIWSDSHEGRWSLLGFGLSLIYLMASVAPQVYLTTAHWYGPVALALVVLAVWNIMKWRRKGPAKRQRLRHGGKSP